MKKARSKNRPRRPSAASGSQGEASGGGRFGVGWRGWPWIVALWGLAVHALSILAGPLASAPVGLLLFGDSLHYIEWGRHAWAGSATALGSGLDGGLPFHPPLVGWLMALLWALFERAESVAVAAKLLMAMASGATYGLFFRLVRDRVPQALPIALLLPLSFGELALTSAVSSEVVYRLILAALILLGRRWAVAAGLLHGLACLTRAEHLPVALVVAGVVAVRALRQVRADNEASAGRRRLVQLAWTVAGALIILVPQLVVSSRSLAAYNERHAAELPRPLPTLVPVSFYGPLNFALAQREAEITFSRRSLPPAPAGLAALDPRFEPHNRVIVDGYRVGLAEIVERPGRFVARSFAKAGHSLLALAHGWTWRDLPKGREWVRWPVDVAYGPSPLWATLCFALIALGAWRLRRQRELLWLGGLLVVYRLAVDVAFFPYLRGMAVAAPFYLALFWVGAASLTGRFGGRLVAAALVGLTLFQLLTVAGERPYRLAGERRSDGSVIDDRPVKIRLAD